jgi:carboxymethylenebutenolidase
VLAPNVFYRSGSVTELALEADLTTPEGMEAFFGSGVMDRMSGLTPDLSNSDTRVWVDALLGRAREPIGVTGYCMGARLAVRAGALYPGTVAAVGGFHGGGLVTQAPDSPHRVLPQARAEFVFGHADNDRSMTPAGVAELGAALSSAGLTHSNEVYVGAAHGYTMADTSSFDEGAAERHFTALKELLQRALHRPTSG